MSYCRFSCDDFQCDILCYEHVNGMFVTHVAENRLVFTEPLPPIAPLDAGGTEWYERHQKVMDMVENAERRPIGLPHDGEAFEDATAGDCAERLERLRSLGYNVPQYAIDALWAEEAA